MGPGISRIDPEQTLGAIGRFAKAHQIRVEEPYRFPVPPFEFPVTIDKTPCSGA